jgi:hypothetical protein
MSTHKMTYAQLEKLYEGALIELDRYRTRYGILAAEVSKLYATCLRQARPIPLSKSNALRAALRL